MNQDCACDFCSKDEAQQNLILMAHYLGACAEGVAWIKTQPDLETAWCNCPRGDWMRWFAAKLGIVNGLLLGVSDADTVRKIIPFSDLGVRAQPILNRGTKDVP